MHPTVLRKESKTYSLRVGQSRTFSLPNTKCLVSQKLSEFMGIGFICRSGIHSIEKCSIQLS